MNKITKQIANSISIILSSTCHYSAYEIRNAILQLNSIDDVILIIEESDNFNLSLEHMVYLRLKGKDEK